MDFDGAGGQIDRLAVAGEIVGALAVDLDRRILRRQAVGPFGENDMISLEQLTVLCHRAAAGEGSLAGALLPVETALDDIPALAVNRSDAARLQRGQSALLRGRDAPIVHGMVYVTVSGQSKNISITPIFCARTSSAWYISLSFLTACPAASNR